MFVCVAGKNDIAVNILECLINNCNNRYELGVVCNRTENGIHSWQHSLRLYAYEKNIIEYKLEQLYEKKNMIFLSLEFDQIVKPELFKDARLFNIHFSLLPQYRGVYTSVIPILLNEKYTGVTLHKIDWGIDTGDIIAQKKFEIKEDYTGRDLYLNYIKFGTQLVESNLESILKNNYRSRVQECKNASYYSKSCIDFSNIEIDLRKTAYQIKNQIRAYNFREYQIPVVKGKSIIATEITNERSKDKPGVVIQQNKYGFILSTLDYNIILYFDRFYELIHACMNGDYECVKEICTVPAHINEVDEKGDTPLLVAAKYNHIEIVKFLLLSGADLNVKNYSGEGMKEFAEKAFLKKGSKRLLKVLEEYAM